MSTDGLSPSGASGAVSTLAVISAVSVGQATGVLRPGQDGRPVPGGATDDGPFRFGQQAAGAPDVHGGSFDVEAGGDLGDADGVAGGHEETVAKLLTTDQWCSDTHYMTQTEISTSPRRNQVVAVVTTDGQRLGHVVMISRINFRAVRKHGVQGVDIRRISTFRSIETAAEWIAASA